jgi:hypothetical protein
MSNANKLVSLYPRLYHMAELGSWPKIQEYGLLSTSALLDLFEYRDEKRFKIESEWRPRSMTVSHPKLGTAIIRDQKPMPPDTLAPVLNNLTPRQWYEFINRKTFFWVTEDRLKRMLNAGEYRSRPHNVLVLDTEALVERHLTEVTLSPINSGVSSFGPPYKRDFSTFKRVEDYPIMEKVRSNQREVVVELAVEYHVPDISELVISSEEWRGKQKISVIWER